MQYFIKACYNFEKKLTKIFHFLRFVFERNYTIMIMGFFRNWLKNDPLAVFHTGVCKK